MADQFSEEFKDLPVYTVDDETVVLALDVPGKEVVLLQTFFELYEGIGAVRTMDIKKSQICVITTPSILPSCLEALKAIQSRVKWKFATSLDDSVVESLFDFNPKRKR